MREFIVVGSCITLLVACGGDSSTAPTASDTGGQVVDATEGDVPDGADLHEAEDAQLSAPLALCGQPPHTWLPSDGMGAVVDTKPLPLYSLSKDIVEVLLADSGFIDVLDVAHDVEVLVVRHTTQDRGVEVEATALVGLPVPPADAPLHTPVVAFLAGTSGFSEGCAGSLSDANALAAIVYATQGYVAVLPDYLGKAGFGGDDGLAHPYIVSEAAAIATWDGVRAVNDLLKSREAVTHDQRVILWGGSQGGHAVYAADRFATHYAPEFELVASIATVAPSDLVGQAVVAMQGLGASSTGLLASFITLSQWHGLWDRITEVVQSNVATWLSEQMTSVCFPALSDVGVETLEDAFQPAFLESVQAGSWEGYETWRCLFAENSARHQTLPRGHDTPLLTVLATDDTLIDATVERTSHAAMCDAGYALSELECEQANHVQGTAWSVREQFAWIRARLANEPLEDACSPTTPTCCASSPPEVCEPTP